MSGYDSTLNYNLKKPWVDADFDAWGDHWNQNADAIDNLFQTMSNRAIVGPSPNSPGRGALWWDSVGGQLYVEYNDGNSTQYVSANSVIGLPITGGQLTGPLLLYGNATQPLEAVPLQQLTAATAGGPFLPINYAATGTPTSRSAYDRAAEVFNVMDYGAKGDGTTDDTAAINAAIAACVYLVNAGWGGIVYFPAKKFRCNGSINLTGVGGFNVAPLVVDAWGAIIDSHATGKPAVDGTWGQCVNINGLTIRGDTTDKPTYGLQMARKDTTGVGNSADWRTNGLTLTGSFSQAAMICLASESAVHVALRINNADPSGDGLRMDGINHFNLTSAFQAITLPVNMSQSFNDNIFVGAIIQTTNTTAGSPLWITGSLGAQFDKSYFSTGGANSIVLFQKSGCNANYNLQLHVHSETSAIHDTILVTGDATGVDLQGLRFEDYYIEATNSVFKLGGSVTSVGMGGCDLRINDGAGGWTKVFDAPAAWTVTGNAVMPPGSTKWNLSSQFIGSVTTGSSQVVSYGSPVIGGNPYFAGTPYFAGAPTFAGGLYSSGVVQAPSLALGSDSQASTLFLLLDTAAGQYRRITYRTAGHDVWSLYTDNSAQSGGNAGSNFQLDRYDDTGAYLGTPIIINRANGFMAVQSGLSIAGGSFCLPPPTIKTGTAYTVATGEYSLILNPTGAFTITLPNAGAYNNGRTLVLKLIAAFTVNSNGNVVVPLAGGVAGNIIMPATVGKWCILTSDGTNWQIMAAN